MYQILESRPGQQPADPRRYVARKEKKMNENPVMRGILELVLSLCLVGFVAHFVCGVDPTGDPKSDKQNEGRSNVVGCLVILCSICLGLLEYSIVKRRNRE